MASPASPIAAPAPAVPVAAPPTPAVVAPVQPILVTEHSRVDAVQNRIAASLAAARAAAVPPTPGMPLQPPLAAAPAVIAPTPVIAPTIAPGTLEVPVVPVTDPAAVVPPAVDLASFDFDAAPTPETAPELPTDGVTTAATTPEADVVRELSEVMARGEVPEKVEEAFLKTLRGRQMLTAFKSMRDLAQAPEKGGIGRVPTMDEIKEADSAHRSVTAMRFEYENDPLSFANNLFIANAETGRTFLGDPAKATQVLEAIPIALFNAAQQSNSPIHAQMLAAYSAPVFNRFFDFQYQQALAMPEESPQLIQQYRAAKQDPPLLADKIRMIDALQLSEFKAFGKPRPMSWTPGQPLAATPSGPDPEKQQLLDRLKAADAQINANNQRQLNGVMSQVDTAGKTAAMGDIDKALKHVGVDKIYGSSIIQSQQRDIYETLKAALPTHDPTGWQRYQIQLQQASRGQADPSVAAATFRQMFQNALRNSPFVNERLTDLVKGAKSNVDAQHQSRLQSQLRTEPTGTGIPAPSSVLASQQLARQPGESNEEFNTRRILAASQRRTAAPAR